MNELLERRLADSLVMEQAAEVADGAVSKIVRASLQAAQTCGCRRCRHAADETARWAAVLLEPAAAPPTEPAD